MGNTLSGPGGRSRIQSLIASAGLPLEIADDESQEENGPLSPFTEAYDARGWFTGVRSTVTIPQPPDVVYRSLASDLHKVFTPMTECHDDIKEEEQGQQAIFRVVRIPFRVAFVVGSLKLRLDVQQSAKTRQIHFQSAQAGRLIKKFIADFDISPQPGKEGHTVVKLDAKINAQSLPPPPFRGMVKDVMVSKMDSCMVDLCRFHSPQRQPSMSRKGSAALERRLKQQASSDLRAAKRRSFDLERGGRPSPNGRLSLDTPQLSGEVAA